MISTIDILGMRTTMPMPELTKISNFIYLNIKSINSKKYKELNIKVKQLDGMRDKFKCFHYREYPNSTQYKIIDCIDNSLLYWCAEDLSGQFTIHIQKAYWLGEIANYKDKIKYVVRKIKNEI